MFCSIYGDCEHRQNFGLIPGIDKFWLAWQMVRGSAALPPAAGGRQFSTMLSAENAAVMVVQFCKLALNEFY